jgi:hypothetical protein
MSKKFFYSISLFSVKFCHAFCFLYIEVMLSFSSLDHMEFGVFAEGSQGKREMPQIYWGKCPLMTRGHGSKWSEPSNQNARLMTVKGGREDRRLNRKVTVCRANVGNSLMDSGDPQGSQSL